MAEEEDDDDGGAPPSIPGMRVWSDQDVERAASAPPTPEERRMFGIPEAPPLRVEAVEQPVSTRAVEVVLPRVPSVVEALVDKFPTFQPDWPEATQTAWFAAFAKLMEAAQR